MVFRKVIEPYLIVANSSILATLIIFTEIILDESVFFVEFASLLVSLCIIIPILVYNFKNKYSILVSSLFIVLSLLLSFYLFLNRNRVYFCFTRSNEFIDLIKEASKEQRINGVIVVLNQNHADQFLSRRNHIEARINDILNYCENVLSNSNFVNAGYISLGDLNNTKDILSVANILSEVKIGTRFHNCIIVLNDPIFTFMITNLLQRVVLPEYEILRLIFANS